MVKREVIKKVYADVDTYCELMDSKPVFKDSWMDWASGVVSCAYSTLGIISVEEFTKLTHKITESYVK